MALTGEKKKAWSAARYRKNRDKLLLQIKQYRQAHPEPHRASNTRWKERNPEAVREARQTVKANRRARLAGTGGTHTAAQWFALRMACGWTCLACGAETEIQKDHIVPIAMGGPNSIDNIQPLCARCNNKKRVATVDYRREEVRTWIAGGMN